MHDGKSELDRMSALGNTLGALAEKQVAAYKDKHSRWIEDLHQFNGRYYLDGKADDDTPFINITRPKTNAAEARLSDILLPTDDRNWGITPTPIPELSKAMQDDTIVAINGQPVEARDIAAEAKNIASEASDAMQDEIDDQLQECGYNAVCRAVIHDAAVFGTGVMKGPVVTNTPKRSWASQKGVDEHGNAHEVHVMQQTTDPRPTAERVDIWDFYPDSSARTFDDAEFVFQRHQLSKRALRKLAKQPGFNAEQIQKVLTEYPDARAADHIADMRAMSDNNELGKDRFTVWEYHGVLEKEDLIACGVDVDVDDYITEIAGVVWFCHNTVIKASINPLDSGEMPFSVFVWDKDDSSIFGLGIPRMIRSSQRVINASWRMVMDNSGLSTGPQIVINDSIIEPVDGEWGITARKVWRLKDTARSVNEAFGAFHISNNSGDLMHVLGTARQLVDEESSVPQIAQGEAGAVPETARGREILINSSNTMLRRIVKNWDDYVTATFIRRMYDWNMQFSDKPDIKGDFNISARGTSALMVKERQAQNLMQLSQIAYSNPEFAVLTDPEKMFDELIKSMQMDADDIKRTEEEIAAMREAPQDQGGSELAKLEVEREGLEVERERIALDLQQADWQREISIMKYAADRDVSLMQAKTELAKAELAATSHSQEIALSKETGKGV